MLSAGTALELLQRADNPAALGRIAAALGFDGRAERVPPELREKLALPAEVLHARMVAGHGSLRALVVTVSAEAGVRAALGQVARGLSTSAPHCEWLVLGCGGAGATTFIAAWLAGTGGPAVRSLIVDRHHVYVSDVETLCAMAACRDDVDVLVHSRWLEVLGRDALTRRFYAALSNAVRSLREDLDASIPAAARAELALLVVSRLLFLSFIQCKGWLNGDHGFLQNTFSLAVAAGGRAHGTLLEPLFFGTLNTRMSGRHARARAFGRVPYLNGGLFARTHVERIHRGARFSDEALSSVFGELLSRYRFTPREDPEDWSETAVDPVILGRAFESLMDPRARRASGTFYTPARVVERATHAALAHALQHAGVSEQTVEAAFAGAPVAPADRATLLERVRALRVLDPACGSGAFLVHVLRVLGELRVQNGGESRAGARAAALANSIYGVDLSATAVWLCQLRLWLCLAVECDAADASEVPPLPNLDRNIRAGDSLSDAARAAKQSAPAASAELARLRSRYARAQGPRKRTLLRALDAAERRAALRSLEARIEQVASHRREILSAARSPDLFGHRSRGRRDEQDRLRHLARALRRERDRLRRGASLSFSYPVQFADVMDTGGFSAIVGNPPWVRPHHIPASTRAALRERFRVCRAAVAGARTPFGAQVDLAAPFVERSLELLREGGTLALLLPAKLWSSLAGASLRQHVLTNARVLAIEDFSHTRALFAAVTYPSLLVAERTSNSRPSRNGRASAPTISIVIHRRGESIEWCAPAKDLSLERNAHGPWLLVPPPVRRAYERVTAAGVPLSSTEIGTPRLGVKTGCNEAFIVRVRSQCRDLAEVCSGEQRGWVERSLLRPVLRGELVRAWRPPPPAEHVIWTHDYADRPVARLPAHASRWLRQWRHALDSRNDARTGGAWWRLFRTAAARNDVHRVVWNDIGRAPRALVLEPGDSTVPINTCYVAFAGERDALALAALLNSPLAAAWLHVLAEPARGGYRRYLAWTIASLPLPPDERRFRETLSPLGEAGRAGEDVSAGHLLDAVLAAYGLRHRDVASLLEWRDV